MRKMKGEGGSDEVLLATGDSNETPSADTQVSRPSIANHFRSGLRTKSRSGHGGLG